MTGVFVTMGGKVAQGFAQKSADDSAAAQLSQEAGQSVAAGIQGAQAMRRRTAYVASNAQSRIAGGGLSTTGTSSQAVLSGIKGQGEYEALTQLYQGQDRASELNDRATQLRNEGNNAVAAGFIEGATSVLKSPRAQPGAPPGAPPGAQTFFTKYGNGYISQYSGGYTNASGPIDFMSD